MKTLPIPDAEFEAEVRYEFHLASEQAFDQVKAAIKNGHLPNDERIFWVIAVGPYFIIKGCGPFSRADLETRSHRPNQSGDFKVRDFLSALRHSAHSRPLGTPIYRIGTAAAHEVLDNYLTSNINRFYHPNARRYTGADFP